MVINDDAGNLTPHGALRFIASELAPTGDRFDPIAYEKPGVHVCDAGLFYCRVNQASSSAQRSTMTSSSACNCDSWAITAAVSAAGRR
ncbi:hypothetical protein B0D71_12125 [Pseudomonas laurylsulfativorans]|uniref:Uncharacterized protein n=1 Tax=Pseudomonas laurylsulfativorans TaxID=1943631 RepID=A0A2S3VQH7_9PSED|nr:hypothetical protein B0D71_12125 [Pseudomonas laurylsulfativorans]